ncbi:FlgO family outer membrane protein [Pseudoalteromonas fenneropenaei]|uniref:FlgO family outer membrane protein n=1 Tax=Pseudoalteromonas fenneropenaei TaxID=1737459 RepID=A0ABV7CH15_9GAMM
MKQLSLGVVALLLSGCLTTVNIDNQHTAPQVMNNAPAPMLNQQLVEPEAEPPAQYTFTPRKHHKQLNDYIEQLALTLSDSIAASNDPTIAVTSFVELNQSLQHTNQLGNQLSEGLMSALQRFGFITVDFKVMNDIKITDRGDFGFSRQLSELNHDLHADHVLSGSLIYRQQGVEIQARVVNLKSKALAASARTVVPYYVLQDIAL